MPIETRSGETAGYKDMTHLEAVGRTLAGVAPWLALPDDDTEEGKLRKQMREEVLKGLKNAVDPASPDLLNFTKHAQPIVDAAYLVHTILLSYFYLHEYGTGRIVHLFPTEMILLVR